MISDNRTAAMQVRGWRVTPGARHGLGEPTATCNWFFNIETALSPEALQRVRLGIDSFWPAEPLPRGVPDDWPMAFVAAGAPPDHCATWAVALTVAIQRLAREPVGFGQVVGHQDRHAVVALPCQREVVLKSAMQFALHHIVLWVQESKGIDGQADLLRQRFAAWLPLVQHGGVSPNTLRFAIAARAQGIPVVRRLDAIRLGWGCHAELLDSSFTGRTSNIAARLARNKNQTSQVLHAAGVPVPPTSLVSNWLGAQKMAQTLGWPVVVKPSNQDQGDGVVPGIRDEAALQRAFNAAAKFSPGAVIVEKHVEGDDHRMLVVGGKLLMATRRVPGGVTGDGVSTVPQLIAQINADPRRGTGKRHLLISLSLDEEALACLGDQGIKAGQVLAKGRVVRLRRTANISTGGTALDVTAQVHPDNRIVAERAARLIGLDIAGVDFLCPDISRSWREVGGAVCEVNAQPGFRPHWLGDPSRDINGEVIDGLFKGKPARIPTAAISGTNGKSTTARMLHHIWMTAGKNAGVCTTSGLWVGHDLVSDQNLSGYPGARMLLDDPAVETAVIEMPRKGLIGFGHPCDRYDVAALLNVQDDHIGVDGIHTLEEMARLKAEVLERASNAVVVNAEDALCLAMLTYAGTQRHILVARAPDVPALQAHLARGGEGVFAQVHEGQPWIVLAHGAAQTPLMPLAEIPATMSGLLKNNEANALFAAAMAWAQNVSLALIRKALAGFANTLEQNPGRYNFIEGFPFQLLLDYAHNPVGVQTLCQVVTQIPARKKIVVCLNLGNRSAAHLQLTAPALANCFDQFILGQDATRVVRCADYGGDDPKGKMLQYFFDQMLTAGIAKNHLIVERDPSAAILRGLACAEPGDLLVLMTESEIAMPLLVVKRKDYDGL